MPNSFFDMTEEERNKVFKDVNEDVKKLTGKIASKLETLKTKLNLIMII